MREEHPIDERFRALHETELTPPAEVRNALAARLGWDTARSTGPAWRNWVIVGAGALLLTASIGAMSYERLRRHELALTSSYDPVSLAPSQEQPTLAAPRIVTPAIPQVAASTQKHSEPSGSNHNSAKDAISPLALGSDDSTVHSPPDHVADPAVLEHTTRNSSTPIAHARPVGGQSHAHANSDLASPHISSIPTNESLNQGAEPLSVGGPPPARLAETYPSTNHFHGPNTEAPNWMAALAWNAPAIPGAAPQAAARNASYVLPTATWWISAYAATGGIRGAWREGPLATLDHAEQWRNTTEYGALIGRQWRNGWSISGGAGFVLTRSTFSYLEQEQISFSQTDTVWSQTYYPITEDSIYTWNMVEQIATRPGASRSIQARNQYGILRIPITALWHGELRRWRFGGFAGLAANVFTQHEGSTLHAESLDAQPRVVSMADPRVRGRYAPQMHGHCGASLGFALTEMTSLYAEPQLTYPLLLPKEEGVSWTSRQLIQIRLQHEFGGTTR